MNTESNKELIIDILTNLMTLMNVTSEFEITEESEIYNVQIKTEDTSLLIGYHGDTLASLEHVLKLIILNKSGVWLKIRIDVDGYKKNREEKISSIARRAIDKCRFLNEPVTLLPMNSFERKVVHELAASEGLSSYSIGEGNNRKVIIAPNSTDGEVAKSENDFDIDIN